MEDKPLGLGDHVSEGFVMRLITPEDLAIVRWKHTPPLYPTVDGNAAKPTLVYVIDAMHDGGLNGYSYEFISVWTTENGAIAARDAYVKARKDRRWWPTIREVPLGE